MVKTVGIVNQYKYSKTQFLSYILQILNNYQNQHQNNQSATTIQTMKQIKLNSPITNNKTHNTI